MFAFIVGIFLLVGGCASHKPTAEQVKEAKEIKQQEKFESTLLNSDPGELCSQMKAKSPEEYRKLFPKKNDHKACVGYVNYRKALIKNEKQKVAEVKARLMLMLMGSQPPPAPAPDYGTPVRDAITNGVQQGLQPTPTTCVSDKVGNSVYTRCR